MKLKVMGLSLILLVSSFALHADAGSEKAAEELLNTMGMDVALEKSIDQMLEVQLQQNPSLGSYKNIMSQFFKKHMNYEGLKPELIKIYSEAFTEAELQDIIAFYETPTGKKTIKLMPELTAQGAQLGAKRVQDNIGELQEMIKAETERLKNE